MAAETTNYQCPACTATLRFSGESGRLTCDFCGSTFSPREVEELYREKDREAAEAFEAEEQGPDWDTSGLSGDWEEADIHALSCPACGAELLCGQTTAATACPYCGNSTIVPGRLAGDLKPDLILPFRLEKEAAIAALKKHYEKKWLLPRAFSDENHLQEIQGLYVPFWLYDAQAEALCRFEGINQRTRRRGNQEITETHHFRVVRGGRVEFAKVPVDASRKMDDSYMNSLEPFDYSQLEPFSTAYLPGFLADRYDQDAQQCASQADQRCKESALSAMREDVLGYQIVTPLTEQVRVHRGKVHYALLPVWVLHTKWKGKDHLFMMNGQTGKLVGDLPVDERKAWLWTAALGATLTLLFQLLGLGPAIAGLFGG